MLSIGTNPAPARIPGTLALDLMASFGIFPATIFAVQTFGVFGPLAGAARVEFRLAAGLCPPSTEADHARGADERVGGATVDSDTAPTMNGDSVWSWAVSATPLKRCAPARERCRGKTRRQQPQRRRLRRRRNRAARDSLN